MKHWLLKGEHMGIPQARHRVIFIAARNDIDGDLESLDMSFNYEPITYGEIKEGKGTEVSKQSQFFLCLSKATTQDKSIGDVLERLGKKRTCFSDKIVWDEDVMPTIVANTSILSGVSKARISSLDIIHSQTFPEDYDFCGVNVGYICGMSVPPVMIKRIVTRLIESGVFERRRSDT